MRVAFDAGAVTTAKPETVMKGFLIALIVGVSAVTIAAPGTAEAHYGAHHHWRHVWHHYWHPGPSYYPISGFYNFWPDPYGSVCIWHRDWDAHWHRDCI